MDRVCDQIAVKKYIFDTLSIERVSYRPYQVIIRRQAKHCLESTYELIKKFMISNNLRVARDLFIKL